MTGDRVHPSPAQVESQLSFVYGVTAMVETASRMGILSSLEALPGSAAEVARRLDLDELSLAVLLRALDGFGVLSCDDGVYRPNLMPTDMMAHWGEIEHRLRSGAPRRRWDTVRGASRYYPHAVRALAETMSPRAEAVARELLDGASIDHVLDLGSGGAPWSLALARAAPLCRVTAIDLAPVLEVTRGAVARAGLSARFELVAGNLFAVPLAEGAYDLCILGMLCHLFDGARNRELLERCRRALRPGGMVALLETLPDGPGAALDIALYELDLLLRTRRGCLHTFDAYREWLVAAGFSDVSRSAIGGKITLVTARR